LTYRVYFTVTETPEMEIPTYSYIIDAKKKRDALRKTGGTSEDFISLSVTKRDNNLGPHPESRLVREEDELGEADDGK
jgi:GC-rich sequence DNA-binding factor